LSSLPFSSGFWLLRYYGEGTSGSANDQSDYNQAFGVTVAKDAEEEPAAPGAGMGCGMAGLPLIAGLLLACLGLGVRIGGSRGGS